MVSNRLMHKAVNYRWRGGFNLKIDLKGVKNGERKERFKNSVNIMLYTNLFGMLCFNAVVCVLLNVFK